MRNEELEKILDRMSIPKSRITTHQQTLEKALLESIENTQNSKKFWHNLISMNKLKTYSFVVLALTILALFSVSPTIRQMPGTIINQAQAKQVVRLAINNYNSLSPEQKQDLNSSLNADIEKLLGEATNAPDLKYQKIENNINPDQPYKKVSFTDTLDRKIVFQLTVNNVPQFILINGAATKSQDSRVGWKTFNSPELGISFEYPDKYKDNSVTIQKGDTGKRLLGFLAYEKCTNLPCSRTGILYGAASQDFTTPKGPTGVEGQGFIKKDNKYYEISSDGQEYEIQHNVKEIQAQNAVGIILSDNQNPSPGAMTSNSRTAIFNLKSSEFKAVTFVVDISQISELEFEKILKTVIVH